ncbi:MAG: site-2 protease family protein [Phycisphaerales bacterium]
MSGWWGFDIVRIFDEFFPTTPKIGVVALCAWGVWFILSIVLHELAHGWTAIRCGDDTPELTGHMTLDPIKHMGIVSLALFAFVGLGWGAMPVNPANFRRRHDDALVAAAGPAMNLLLAILCVVCAIISNLVLKAEQLPYALAIFRIGSVMNLTLCLLNLVPLPPLDGSRVLASFIRPMREWVYSPQGALIGMIGFLIFGRLAGPYVIVVAVLVCVGAEQLVVTLLPGGHATLSP